MKTLDITHATPVGRIAAAAPLATRVFARHGIDFCCGGGVSLQVACERQGVPTQAVLAEIRAELETAPGDAASWEGAPLDALIEHILVTYHAPLKTELPRLDGMARKVLAVHGDKDPQRLEGIATTLAALRAELEQHMQKEERILFPMIRRGEGALAQGPVMVMEHEHEAAGGMLRTLRRLTDDHVPPEGACNTWRALYHGLADLERALHEHIHLENNILFPRALGR